MESPVCTFCQNSEETMLHLLVVCEYAHKLWRLLEKWINYYLKVDLTLTKDQILLNNYTGANKKMINFLIIVMKQHIYSAKCFQEIPVFQQYVTKLSKWFHVDRIIALENNTSGNFVKKWKNMF